MLKKEQLLESMTINHLIKTRNTNKTAKKHQNPSENSSCNALVLTHLLKRNSEEDKVSTTITI